MNPNIDDILSKATVVKDYTKTPDAAEPANAQQKSVDEILKTATVVKEMPVEKKNPSGTGSNGSATSSASPNTSQASTSSPSEPSGSGAYYGLTGRPFWQLDGPITQKIGDKQVDLRESAPIPFLTDGAAADRFAKELQQRISTKTVTPQDVNFLSSKSGFSPDEVLLSVHEPEKFTKYTEISNRMNNAEISINDMDYLAKNMPGYAKGLIQKLAPDVKPDLTPANLSLATDKINKYVQGKISESKAAYFNNLDSQIKAELSTKFDVTKLKNEAYAEKALSQLNTEKDQELSLLARKYPLKNAARSMGGLGDDIRTYRVDEGKYNQEKEAIENKYTRLFGLLATSRTNDIAKERPTEDPFQIGLEYLKFADRDKYLLRQKAGAPSGIDRDVAQMGVNSLYTTNNPGIWDLLAVDEKNLDNYYPDKKRSEVYHKLGAVLYKDDNWFLNAVPSIKEMDAAAEKLAPADKEFYVKNIRPLEKRIIGTNIPMSGLVNKIGEGFVTTTNETGKFIGDISGLRSTQEQAQDALNMPYQTEFQDVGAHGESVALLRELNAKEKSVGLNKEEQAKKDELLGYTNVRSNGQEIIDGTGNLTGQVLFQALATKGLGGAASGVTKAAGLLKVEQIAQGLATEEAIAAQATNFGVSKTLINALSADAIAFGSSYDASMRDALTLFPDDKDKTKRYIYANTVAGLNAATERIFKDEKVLDAFNKEVAPNISKLVSKMSSEGLSKELFKNEVKQVVKNGLNFLGHAVVENTKETVEELATSIGTSVATLVLAPSKFNAKQAYDDAINTVTTTFLSGGLVAGMASVHHMKANYAAIPMLSQLGIDPGFTNNVKTEINRQLLANDLTPDEANEKFRMVNDAIAINKNEMNDVNGKDVSEKTKGKYFTMLLNEKNLQHQIDNTTDDVAKDQLQKKLDESKAIREGILKNAVSVDENYLTKQNPVEAAKPDAEPVVNKDEALGNVKATADALSMYDLKNTAAYEEDVLSKSKLPDALTKDYSDIAQEYHQAKQDGSNPELVDAVENIFNQPAENKTTSSAADNSSQPDNGLNANQPANNTQSASQSKEDANLKGKVDFAAHLKDMAGKAKVAMEKFLTNNNMTIDDYNNMSEAEQKVINEKWRNSDEYKDYNKEPDNNVQSVPQMDDVQLEKEVGRDVFKQIQKSEDQLGEGIVDRNRLIETAKRIQQVEKKDKLLPQHVMEALLYETGYPDNWQDLRNSIKKGGIDNNSDAIERQLEVGVKLPNDIVEAFKESERYKTASPEVKSAVENILSSNTKSNESEKLNGSTGPQSQSKSNNQTKGEVGAEGNGNEKQGVLKDNGNSSSNTATSVTNDGEVDLNSPEYLQKVADEMKNKVKDKNTSSSPAATNPTSTTAATTNNAPAATNEPVKTPAAATSASAEEQAKIDAKNKALAEFKAAMKESRGNLNSGIDPKVLATGIKLIGTYIDLGIYKFGQIANEIAKEFGEKSQDLLRALKQAYGGYLAENENDNLDDIKTVRDFTFDENSNEGENSDEGYTLSDEFEKHSGELLALLNEGRKGKDVYEITNISVTPVGGHHYALVTAKNNKPTPDSVYNVLDENGKAPEGFSPNWKVFSLAFKDMTSLINKHESTDEGLSPQAQDVINDIKADTGMPTRGVLAQTIFNAANSSNVNEQMQALEHIYQQTNDSNREEMEQIVGKKVIDKVMAMDFPAKEQSKASAPSSPNVKDPNRTIKVANKDYVFVGKNIDGFDMYEDNNGVRVRDTGNKSFYDNEPVNIIPTAAGYVAIPARPDDFKTIAEIEQELGKELPQPKISGNEVIAANDPMRVFKDTVKQNIIDGVKQNIISLRKLATELGINTKDTTLQEMAELAVVELSRDVAQSNQLDEQKLTDIIRIYDNQPSITMRSSERIDKQQYSTPVPMSFIAGMYLGAINPKTVFEPSAGNGAMTIYFDPSLVHVNEIDNVRLDNLAKQNFGYVTNQDALKPFKLLPQDGIILNPPFGSSPEIVEDGYKVAGLDEKMVINALKNLAPNGRAAFIMGGHNSYDTKGRLKSEKTFFNYLYNHYNVVDVINMDGNLYKKQGTSFPNRMILIDGVKLVPEGVAPLRSEAANAVVSTFEDLYNRINSIKDIRYAQNILSTGVDGNTGKSNDIHGNDTQSQGTQNEAGSTSIPPGQVRPVSEGSAGTERTPGTNDTGGIGSPNNASQSNGTGIGVNNNEQRPVSNLEATVPDGRTNEGGENVNAGSEGNVSGNNPVQSIRKFDTGELSNEKVPYRPKSNGTSVGTVIPSQMATEAERILSDINDTYGGIDNFVMKKLQYKNTDALYKAFSAEQIDALAMAVKQIEEGQGMIIGDMTGVGKGRIAAGVVRYAVLQGSKPIFLTEKPNLFSDLYRDLMAIGSEKLVPFIVNDKSAASDPTITDEEGNVVHKVLGKTAKKNIFETGVLPKDIDFVMSTYSQFRTSPSKPSIKKDFFQKVADGNILILDESHNVSGDSNSGQLFQDVLANSKGVTYLSATFAKRPDNMPVYAIRTAMQEANMTKEELIGAIENGGVALQEVVSSQLVESGQMLRRERSFDGVDISYEIMDDYSDAHRQIADNVTEIVRDIIDFQKIHVNSVIDQLDSEVAAMYGTANGKKGTSMAGVDNTPFASKVFNVIDQLLFSIKANEVANAAIEEVKAGRKPVIGFKSTMGSFLNDLELSPGEKLDKVDFSLTLNKGLNGTMRYTEKNDKGDAVHKSLSVSDLSPEGQRAYQDIRDKIKAASLGITISPIDVMIKKIQDAGFTVKEITGRDLMLELQDDGSAVVVRRTDKDVKKISREFNSGNLDVIMINASGATGISLHASKTFKDQRQRVMIDGQLELDINKAVQKRGRIDRTGQVVRGAFRYLVTAIPAEKRLLMMFKSKLKSLDANTTSSQKSKTSDVDVEDFLNKYGDEIVTEYLKEDKEINEKLLDPLKLGDKSDEDLESTTKVEDAARKVTGRVAILNSVDQQHFYEEVTSRYLDYMEYLESNNSNDLEVKVLPLNAKTLAEQVVTVGKGGESPFGKDSVRETLEVDILKKPLTKQEIDTEVEANLNGQTPEQQRDDNVQKIEDYYDNFMVKEQDAINQDYENKKPGVIDTATKRAIKEGANVEYAVKDALEKMEISKRDKIDRLMRKYEGIKQVLSRQMAYFKTGVVYEVPTSIKVETSLFTVKGVFLGFQIKANTKNPYAPSAIKMRFAVNDGRRMVSVPLSKQAFVNSVIANSSQYQQNGDQDRKNTRENWDSLKSARTRDQRYMITGNLLQAYGTNDGQLVSYTDDQGNMKKGLLLPEDYKADEQKVRIPITRAMAAILSGDKPVSTVDKEVTISKEKTGFTIDVPLSKISGGKYFLDPKLRELIAGNDFKQLGGKMVGYFSQSKLPDVLHYLETTHNSSVEVDANNIPSSVDPTNNAFKTLADRLRELKIKGKDNLFSLVPPFNLVPAAWNAAIEIAALTIQGGGKLYEAARRALNYIKSNYPNTTIDEVEFQDTIKRQLVDNGTIPQSMNRETLKMAKLAVASVKAGSTIDAELAKIKNFFDKMKALMSTPEEINELDNEYAMAEEYIRGTVLERPPGASINPQEALDKAAQMKEGLEERVFSYSPETLWQKFLAKAAAGTNSVLSVGGKIFNAPTAAQEKTIGWLTKKGGDEFKKVAGKQLAKKNGYIRGIAKAMNSMISGMGKTHQDINAAEKFQGESKRRSVSDAAKISGYLRNIVDNNKTSLVNIDQLIDPEFYTYLQNMPVEEFAQSVKYDEPHITDAEIATRYKEFRDGFGFDNPDYHPMTEDDLTPEEQSVYKIIRELYDYMHELNYGMGKLTEKTYYANYKNYSARLYDEFELPAEINESLKNSPLKMDVDLYMKRGNLTSWKALHKLQDPVYGVTKRLYQTLANKAVLDYADHVVTNRPDVISSYEKPGFTKLGEGYGKLSNQWVRDDMAEDFKGYFFASAQMQKFYEFLKGYDRLPVRQFYKKIFTVYNPGVHVANIMGNTWFGMLSGINPLRLNLNLLYAKQQIDSYGEDYRQLLSDGVVGTDYSREDLIQKTDELFNKNVKPDNTQNIQQNGVLPGAGKVVKTFLGKMQDFYGATDDVYKIAAYRSLRQLGYNHADAANKVKQGFQNYQRVAKAYDVGSKLPIIGNPFGKFAGDLARIVVTALKERPLTAMAFLASLQAVGVMISKSNGEDDEKRRRRMNRPGVPKIPVPDYFPEWLGGGREGGISLAWKMGDKELNIAKFLSPVFVYSAYDGDNSMDFVNKFSPLPIEGKPDFTYNPNGVWAVAIAKNANDPLIAPFAQMLVNSDFRGMPILDPGETKYRESTMTFKEKSINSLRFLARAYVPHGAYADDFVRAVKGEKDYYGREMTPGQIFGRFLGYKTIPFGEEKYDEVLDKRVRYWENQFKVETAKMNTLLTEQANEKVSEDDFTKRESEILQNQAHIVSDANKEIYKMTGEDQYFEPPEGNE